MRPSQSRQCEPGPISSLYELASDDEVICHQTSTLMEQTASYFPLQCPKELYVSSFYCCCQCLLYLSLLSKSLSVSASKSIKLQFIIYWCVYSSCLKSSFIQTNTLLKGSFHSIGKVGKLSDYLEFTFTLITLEGNLSTTYVISYSRNTELIS